MQATLSTGEPPSRHGIVSNGLYFHDTAEVRFWEQSAHLVNAPRVWDLPVRNAEFGVRSEKKKPRAPSIPHSALRTPHLKVALLFWQQSLYGSADIVLSPKPIHGPGDKLIQDCYSRPGDLYARLAAGESSLAPGTPRGPFNLMHYWGPMAGLGSTALDRRRLAGRLGRREAGPPAHVLAAPGLQRPPGRAGVRPAPRRRPRTGTAAGGAAGGRRGRRGPGGRPLGVFLRAGPPPGGPEPRPARGRPPGDPRGGRRRVPLSRRLAGLCHGR